MKCEKPRPGSKTSRRTNRVGRLGIAGCLAWLSAAAPAPAGAEGVEWFLPENPLNGGKLFVERGCIQCHAIYGEGGQGGPDLGKTKLHRGFLEIAGVMWNHSPRMMEEYRQQRVERPTFSPDEMAQIIAFVYYLNYFDSPGDPERGEGLFSEKGCGACHSVGGKGGRIGSPLDRFHNYVSAVFITTAMWNSGPEMAEEMRKRGMKRPVFESGDVRDILSYIRQAATRSGEESKVFLPPGNPRNGARLFRERRCTDCHAIRESKWTPGPDLGALELRESLSTIAGFQWNHGPAMWATMQQRGLAIPQFTDVEMSDIVTYLYFIQYAEEPGDPDIGREVFTAKGCTSCHDLTGERTTPGRAVPEMEPFESPAAAVAAMWNHASEMEEKTWELDIVWPILRGNEMADLIAFLQASYRPEGSRP